VFPQLLGHDAEPLEGGAHSEKSASAPALEEKDVKALKESIANVAASANHLADLGKLAEGTNKLSEKLAAASQAADKFAGAGEGLAEGAQKAAVAAAKLGESYTASVASVQAAAQSSEATAKSAEVAAKSAGLVAQHLEALNAAYELQLKAAKDGQKEADAYEAELQKLNKQVADLNKIYGNMLSALA
jgi:methyl-accepting chemotaxis protein